MGINIPAAGLETLGFRIEYSTSRNSTINTAIQFPPQGSFGHVFSWSHPYTTVSVTTANTGNEQESLLSSIDARSIDKKFDDGLPYSGNIFASNFSLTTLNCVDNATQQYILVTDELCGQYYRNFLE